MIKIHTVAGVNPISRRMTDVGPANIIWHATKQNQIILTTLVKDAFAAIKLDS